MKRFIGVLSVLALLFLMEVQLGAQNNQYKIDDSCYAIYRQADSLIGKPEAAALIDKLEVQAKDVEDDKAYTLAAVLKLRNARMKSLSSNASKKSGRLPKKPVSCSIISTPIS